MSESNVMAVNFFARKYTFCTGLRVAQYLVKVVEVVKHTDARRLTEEVERLIGATDSWENHLG